MRKLSFKNILYMNNKDLNDELTINKETVWSIGVGSVNVLNCIEAIL